eukprot:CAMPEP_0185590344 /NCGR_PEP_ID=MMETSP0434-20130131/60463_1 /TAXON_ID=626734 ORGANISM="Favella taraikaensis, Strain Fe Narragansett Bay" /NCGR_SAMPLE_ID=MMETSP0434 /ASSEMBLY_ACC=CAM_ASM_000379 /LENGTH=75 /DNA_ID=CAMNT_0028214457 /DNA_START=5 /DNA_END=229 /DNA_ORIENTATION=-
MTITFNRLKSGLKVVENQLKAAQTRNDNKFIDVMEPVLMAAQREVESATEKWAEMQESFEKVRAYLGEDAKALPE